ncbi:serine/threonine-protein phosphatase 7 long form-like protein [Senna tora]|uniref:Serine/threonine-protein phosphatase 7 long form-like protein n=1 Tax=Senna tora TaxID=362788 RepID=A0A834XES1_9FABA|nr:serine/threonine-protein phosphatase 7 long form-like protein [Senna tora]
MGLELVIRRHNAGISESCGWWPESDRRKASGDMVINGGFGFGLDGREVLAEAGCCVLGFFKLSVGQIFNPEISTHDINMDIENQLSFDYNTQPTPQTDQTLILSSSRLQIVGTCQPSTEDLGEFSDEDEYEASVPIRMSHQDKEDDNVWEDVVEEELANFYSQVDVERARGFTGDFGPHSEDVGELYEGMKFPTKAALRRHVKLYHIKNNCTFVVAKSGSNFEDWRCPKFGKKCAWRLRATQKIDILPYYPPSVIHVQCGNHLMAIILRYFEFDNALVSALVERWRPEPHTFHMTQGECTVTLQDVAILLGLPCVGVPVVGQTGVQWAEVCLGLLGHTPPEGKLRGQRLSMKWLDETFSFANFPLNPTIDDIEHFARAYILKLIRGYLMPDKSSKKVYLMYLSLLADLTAVRTFSWGSAVLAYLYRELCNATDPDTHDISSCMVLLHLWAWERFPALAPHEPHFIDPQVDVYRRTLPPKIKWRPYDEDHVSQQIPYFCIDNRDIWRANVPLICFHIVEWQCSDRVLRQFGMDQPIPENPVEIDFLHTLILAGKTSVVWFREHQHYIQRNEILFQHGKADVMECLNRAYRVIDDLKNLGNLQSQDPFFKMDTPRRKARGEGRTEGNSNQHIKLICQWTQDATTGKKVFGIFRQQMNDLQPLCYLVAEHYQDNKLAMLRNLRNFLQSYEAENNDHFTINIPDYLILPSLCLMIVLLALGINYY